MPYCEMTGTSFAARITFEVNQDVSLNQSMVRVTRVEMRAMREMSLPCFIAGSICINGVKAAELAFTDTTACIVNMTQQYTGGGAGDSWFSGFRNWDVRVGHNSDGSARAAVYANLLVYHNQQQLDYGVNKTVDLSLPAIPRVTELEAQGVTLGQRMQIRRIPSSANFVDTVSWSCGELSGIVAEKTDQENLEWIPPLELATQATETISAAVVLTVTTYLGDSVVGSRQTELHCPIPETVVPTLEVGITDETGVYDSYGAFLRSQSQAVVQTWACGAFGSQIRDIQVRCGGLTGTGERVVFALENDGTVPISVTVTDSRGRTAQYETAIWVHPYQKPTVTIRGAYRCDELGVAQADGQWLRVVFDAQTTGQLLRTIRYTGICTVHGGTERWETELTEYTGQSEVSLGSFLMQAGMDTAYDCLVTVQDDFSAVTSSTVLVSVAFAMLDLCRGTRAVGIGMRAKNPGKLSIGMDADLDEHRIRNLADPAEDRDGATKGYVDGMFRKAVGQNLLDNSFFLNPVNQRGASSISENGYFIDRWRVYSQDPAKSTARLTSQGLQCDESHVVHQIVPGEKALNLLQEGYTIACGRADGTVEMDAGMLWEDGSGNYVCALNAGTWAWAALYPGEFTAETLPEYRQKPYGQELNECQRCYLPDAARFCSGVAYGGGSTAYISIPTPVRIRENASVYMVNADYLISGNQAYGIVSMEVTAVSGNCVLCRVTVAGQFPAEPAVCCIANQICDIIAEL